MYQIRRLFSGIEGSSRTQQVFKIENSLEIGSSSHSRAGGVTLKDAGVWGRHCRISRADAGWIVSVLDAPSVDVNHHSVQQGQLRSGDILRIGESAWQFEMVPARQRSGNVVDRLWLVSIFSTILIQILIIYWIEKMMG